MNERQIAGEPAIGVEMVLPVEAAAMESVEMSETPESLRAVENEAPGFFSKLKDAGEKVVDFFSHEEARKQVAGAAVGVMASVAGIKSFYDVPNYLHQRFMVRGIDLGPFGKAEGLTGSVEHLLGANREMRDGSGENSVSESGEGSEGESHAVRDAIKDLNERLALTKEGEQKGSEQRKMLAKLLIENRTKERMNAEERSEQMTTILDEYTTTKVTGMQAARETLNTALVASGAMSLRGISYSMLDGVERYQRLSKEAGEGEKPEILKDVILGGINETLEEARFGNSEGKSRLRTGLDSVKAWGKILRVVGMGSTVSLRPEAIGNDMEKVLDAFSGKASLGDVAENFQGNIDRTIEGYARVAKAVNPFQVAEANAGDFVPNFNSSRRASGVMELDLDKMGPDQGKGQVVSMDSDKDYLPGGKKSVINEVVPKKQPEVVFQVKKSMDDLFAQRAPKGGKVLYDMRGPAAVVEAPRTDARFGDQESPEQVPVARGSRGGLSLAERAAAANADLGKGSSAIETLQKPGVGFAEKMSSLKGAIGDGEAVNMNGLNIMRKGSDFFLTSNGKSVRITEGNLNDILRVQDKGRAEFFEEVGKGTKKPSLETSSAVGSGRIVNVDERSGNPRVGRDVSEALLGSRAEYTTRMDALKSAIPDGESKSIGGLTFGRDGKDIYLIDSKRGEVKLVTPENMASILASQRKDGLSYDSGTPGSRGGLSLAERAAAANADLGKGSSAIETLQKPGVGFAEKMSSLKGTIGDGEAVNMNGLNIMRKGSDFFLTSNGKSVRITEGNLNDILRVQDKGRAESLEEAMGIGKKMPLGSSDRISPSGNAPTKVMENGGPGRVGGSSFERDSDKDYLPGGKKSVINEVVPKKQPEVVFQVKKSMDDLFAQRAPKGGKVLYDMRGPAAPDELKGGSAAEALLDSRSSYSEKLAALGKLVPEGETVDVNGLRIGRSGNGFFLGSGSNEVRITPNNIGKAVEIYAKAREGFFKQ